MSLLFLVSPGKRLIFTESAVSRMRGFAQTKWWHTEAGGVLIGRHLLDSEDVVVDEVTTPQDSDRRSRFGFFRSKGHQTLARRRWAAQAKTAAYLGLWHTHPEADPTPSSVDCADWLNAATHDTFEGEYLFFPIVGTRVLRVWSLDRKGQLAELSREEDRHA